MGIGGLVLNMVGGRRGRLEVATTPQGPAPQAVPLRTLVEDPKFQEALPVFPSTVQVLFREFEQLVAERGLLQETLRVLAAENVPVIDDQKEVYDQRIRDIESRLAVVRRIGQAVRLGYQPYNIPATFYTGGVRRRTSELNFVFNAPMPLQAIRKLDEAQGTKLFAHFVVAAPDKGLFQQTREVAQPVASMFNDPFLVGFVQTGEEAVSLTNFVDNWRPTMGLVVKGGVGFLIAHWDLEKDRRAARLAF